jgi:hypothetical protein
MYIFYSGVDVSESKDLFELKGDHGKGITVVALARVQHPGNAADVTQIQTVQPVFFAVS